MITNERVNYANFYYGSNERVLTHTTHLGFTDVNRSLSFILGDLRVKDIIVLGKTNN